MGAKSFSIERKQRILEHLDVLGRVEVADLAKELNVSKETLRKDLRELEQENLLKRTHGGAVGIHQEKNPSEIKYIYRVKQKAKEKELICRKAASLIENGDTVFIDNSSTNLAIIKYIDPSYTVTVITNSIRVLLEEDYSDRITLISIGGIFRKAFFSCVGDFANEMAKKFHPNKAFVSAYGVDTEGLIYDISMYETEVKNYFMRVSEKTYFTADHSKLGKRGGAKLSSLDIVDYFICDKALDESSLKMLQKHRVELIVADKSEVK